MRHPESRAEWPATSAPASPVTATSDRGGSLQLRAGRRGIRIGRFGATFLRRRLRRNVPTAVIQSVNRGGAFFREIRLPAPKNSRELFRLFSLYEKETGISGLVDRINFENVTSSQLYFSILRRPPERRHLLGQDNASCDPKQRFCEMICSDEFQSRLIQLLLESFPEKRRLFYIHIPKSAGSHFFARIAPLYPCINKLIDVPDWTSKVDRRFFRFSDSTGSFQPQLCDTRGRGAFL